MLIYLLPPAPAYVLISATNGFLFLHACCQSCFLHPSVCLAIAGQPDCFCYIPASATRLLPFACLANARLPACFCYIPAALACLAAASQPACFCYMLAAFCLLDCCLSACCCYIPAHHVCLTASRQPASFGFVPVNLVCLTDFTPYSFLLLLSTVVCPLYEDEKRMPLDNSKCCGSTAVTRIFLSVF
jgi:hypothetical protein